MEKQLALGKETLTAAADLAGTASLNDDWLAEGDGRATRAAEDAVRAEGSMLRTLHALLVEEDPTLADLPRGRDQAGRYLWVHRRYLPIYQPRLPDIPT